MDCEDITIRLGQYLDHELAPEVRRDVEAHLTVCSRCARELGKLDDLVAPLAALPPPDVPETLWAAVERRLTTAGTEPGSRRWVHSLRTPATLAASVVVVAGAGLIAALLLTGTPHAEAATVDFGELLAELPLNADQAFENFLVRYDARPIPAEQARQHAPKLNFSIPATLPGGFGRQECFALQFGAYPGVAARYSREGELLAVVFHPPFQHERYGEYKDQSCIIGKGHGHEVQVGPWRLVHLTDKTTCHCVLSKLDKENELPAIMKTIAPRFVCNCGCQD